MRRRSSIFAIIAGFYCLQSFPVYTQSTAVLVIEEVNRSNGRTVPVPEMGLAIVDINSQLLLRPNREAVRLRALQTIGQTPAAKQLSDRIQRIERALREQERLVMYIRRAIETPHQPPDSLLLLLRATMRDIGSDTLLRERYNQYSREYTEQLRIDPSLREREDRFLYILGRYNETLDSFRQELKALEKSARMRFSLRAFRKDRSGGQRLHIENFDQFEQGQFFEVENWALVFSADQLEQLQKLRELAGSLNQNAEWSLQDFRERLFEMLPALRCIEQIPTELRLASETIPRNVFSLLDSTWNQLREQVDGLRDELMTLSSGANGYDVKARWSALRAQVELLYQKTMGQLEALPQTNVHVRNLLNCAQQTRADIERIERFVRAFPDKYLRRVYLASDELVDEVLRFELDQIPEVGTLDLVYTGRREPGDELLIQALLVPEGEAVFGQRFIVLYERALVMIQVGPHTAARVGLLMANPYTLQQPEAARFRFTPSAGLLLKFGHRRSHFYNRFFDPGIGIVTASPDFSLDGIPEFGAGLVATAFRDILSTGWCWNFGINKPFYFIGVNLPFHLPSMPPSAPATPAR